MSEKWDSWAVSDGMTEVALAVVAIGNCGRSEILVKESEEIRSAACQIYRFSRV